MKHQLVYAQVLYPAARVAVGWNFPYQVLTSLATKKRIIGSGLMLLYYLATVKSSVKLLGEADPVLMAFTRITISHTAY